MSAHFSPATQFHFMRKLIRHLRQSEYREKRLRRARSVLRLEKALEIKNKKNLFTNTIQDLLLLLDKTSLCQDLIASRREEDDFSEELIAGQGRKPFTLDKHPEMELYEDRDRWVWDSVEEDANPVCYYDEDEGEYIVAPGAEGLLA
jgi:hypothetical protein